MSDKRTSLNGCVHHLFNTQQDHDKVINEHKTCLSHIMSSLEIILPLRKKLSKYQIRKSQVFLKKKKKRRSTKGIGENKIITSLYGYKVLQNMKKRSNLQLSIKLLKVNFLLIVALQP